MIKNPIVDEKEVDEPFIVRFSFFVFVWKSFRFGSVRCLGLLCSVFFFFFFASAPRVSSV